MFARVRRPPPPRRGSRLPADFECPSVTVRQGASTLTFSANPAEPTAMNLRYQIGFGETARECRMAPGNMLSMRVGVQGRVILGPAGGARPGRRAGAACHRA